MQTLPDSTRIEVAPELSRLLFNAAQRLPMYDNKDFYDSRLQAKVHDAVRLANPVEFDALVVRIHESLAARPYAALVRGLRFDDGNRVFVALNRAFGELVARPYERPRAQLVHYIQQATDRPSSDSGRYESENLHTDTADWNPTVELISMVCVRADKGGGGRSRILDVDTLRAEVESQMGKESLELLEAEPVPWELAADQGGGVTWRPVLSEAFMCWRPYTMEAALKSLGTKLSDQLTEALAALEKLIASVTGTLEFLMSEGEWLLVDNHRTIHSRTPIVDATSDRLMIRSWIKTTHKE